MFKKIILLGVFCLTLFSQRQYSIAILADDFNEESLRIQTELITEINSVLGNNRQMILKEKYQLESKWSVDIINQHYKDLVNANDVDIILVAGAFSSSAVARLAPFKKPVILVGVFDSETQGIQYIEGKSGVKNLTYVRFADRMVERLEQFYSIYNFKRLGFLYDRQMIPFINLERTEINSFFLSKNSSYKIIEFDQRLTDDDQLKDVDAVFVGDIRWISPEDKRLIYERINRLKLPSFTQSPQDVQFGAFASTTNSGLIPKVLRRIALLVEAAVNGDDLANENVDIEFELEYQINFSTSRQINISPPYDILIEAKLYGLTDEKIDRFSLQQVIGRALEQNRNYKAAKLNVDLQEKEFDQSKSNLYPQVSSSFQVVRIDDKRARLSQGQTAATTYSTGLSLEQVIYSDAVNANKHIQELLLESETEGYQIETYDLVKTVGDLYYDILKLQALFNIQLENVDVNKQNLSLAKIRLKTGFSDVSDVYRWESQLAVARQDLLAAVDQLNNAKRSLGLLIDRPTIQEFNIDASNLDSIYQVYNNPIFSQYADNPISYDKLIKFFVILGLQQAPELKQLTLAKQIQERVITSKRREHVLPSIALGGDYSRTLSRAGLGDIDAFQPPETNWSLALRLSLPLFKGFSTVIDQEIAEIQRQQVEYQFAFLSQKLEVDIRNQFNTLKINQVKINLSDRAAEFAEKSLKLIQESYSKGQVSVIELLDAQNAYIQAKSAASSSLYDYLKSILAVERAISSFLFLDTDENRDRLRQRFLEFVNSKSEEEG